MNFEIQAGQIFAVAGAEGNGQSELAQILISLIPASSGASIKLSGVDVTKKSINDRYKLGLSLCQKIDTNTV